MSAYHRPIEKPAPIEITELEKNISMYGYILLE